MFFSFDYDKSLWLILAGDSSNKEMILEFISSIPSEFYNKIKKGLKEYCASKRYSLGDILYDNGYNNYFLLGSKAEFGGRLDYFTKHGKYEIYDYANEQYENNMNNSNFEYDPYLKPCYDYLVRNSDSYDRLIKNVFTGKKLKKDDEYLLKEWFFQVGEFKYFLEDLKTLERNNSGN